MVRSSSRQYAGKLYRRHKLICSVQNHPRFNFCLELLFHGFFSIHCNARFYFVKDHWYQGWIPFTHVYQTWLFYQIYNCQSMLEEVCCCNGNIPVDYKIKSKNKNPETARINMLRVYSTDSTFYTYWEKDKKGQRRTLRRESTFGSQSKGNSIYCVFECDNCRELI